MSIEDLSTIAERYRRFADEEAAGRSPLYETLARGIAGDEAVLRFVLSLPEAKRQPNLLLAAVRHLFGPPETMAALRTILLENAEAVRSVMLFRATQTNEPGRCAALLPIFARLPEPLALIEIGAAAGLCLLPDRYGYDYGAVTLRPEADYGAYPIFPCQLGETVPIPGSLPQIVWRAGLDLHPLDPSDPADAEWLETLVWPGQEARLARIRVALAVAASARPRIVAGDLLGDALPALVCEVPCGATTVVFHNATLAYVAGPDARRAFAERVASLCSTWISYEAPGVFPEIACTAPRPPKPGAFLLSLNGDPVAWADPHGASLDWIEGDDAMHEGRGWRRPG
ncbi:DUF2332 domain-containing protein [Muricoccus radiodurans]|uniref:DUF2332 domain-containing protein n=1 Tax=Muricoccus radiodurans TaxID=2231721 RepID=UPI003CE8C877